MTGAKIEARYSGLSGWEGAVELQALLGVSRSSIFVGPGLAGF